MIKQVGYIFVLFTSFAAAGCGSSSGSPSSGSPAGGDNGCTLATAEDHTKDAAPVVINFGGAIGVKYAPACIVIGKGQSVTFTGSFSAHPLQAGTVDDGGAHPATGSPIQATSTGATATFAIPSAGTFPYYCTIHANAGMKGAIYAK